jgi:NAD(P)-dependent dehydrogenase (short-subunit alcohol dehydrogenase family)
VRGYLFRRCGPLDRAVLTWDARRVPGELYAGRGSPATETLLERDGELAAFGALFEAAGRGHGGLVLVEGPPGVGKSALLEQAAAIAREHGLAVLHARGHELERAFGWGVARSLFESSLVGRPDAARDELLAGPAGPARHRQSRSAGRRLAMPVDLAAPDGPALLIGRALDEHRRVDVLVNNVGAVRLRLEGFLGTSDEEFEWAMQINFFSALRATRAARGPMIEQGSGAIVNVASVNSFFQPDAGTIDYGAAKAALLNLSKSRAQEFGSSGIHVNCVSPGPVSTDLWLGDHGVAETVAKATGVDADTARATVVAGIGGFATGRFTTPEEVAALTMVLASERTANVTGANYVIDGGLIKTM